MTLSGISRRLRNSAKALLRPDRPLRRRDIELFYWRPKDGRQNFGDHLSIAIASKLAAEHDFCFDEIVPEPRRLFAIGSILQYAQNNDVVWGTGWNGNTSPVEHRFPILDVRAVRGPLTRDVLRSAGVSVPAVFGDPALLTRQLFQKRFQKTRDDPEPLLIPHFADLEVVGTADNIVSPYSPWPHVVQRIVNSQLVISSSLHGLIIADAFSIPCIYLRLSEHESFFKFEDYILGSNRNGLAVATSLPQAYRLSPIMPGLPDLSALKAAFPYDLWSGLPTL